MTFEVNRSQFESQQAQTNPFSIIKAQRLCQCAFGLRDAGKKQPLSGFETEFSQYQQGWKCVQSYRAQGDLITAARIAWAVANKYVLGNPKLMSFYIVGAYRVYIDLVKQIGRSLEGEDIWNRLNHHLDVFEAHLIDMMQMNQEKTRQELAELITDQRFGENLANTFMWQDELTLVEDRLKLSLSRKNVIYSAMALFSRCKAVLKQEALRQEWAKPQIVVKTPQEIARERKEREAKRKKRSRRDQEFREKARGSSAAADSRGVAGVSRPSKKR